MKFKLLLFFLVTFLSGNVFAQYKIEGQLTPASKKIKWAILYKIKEGKQVFYKNTKVKGDAFEFEIPETAVAGMYRVVYRMKGQNFIDILFNKEDVKFTFHPDYPEGTAVFSSSTENKIYQSYLEAISYKQHQVDSIQIAYFRNPIKALEIGYQNAMKVLNNTQHNFEQASNGKLVFNFIKATRRYNSDTIVPNPSTYLKGTKENFFNHIDFFNSVLINSSFLVDRMMDYIFKINYSNNKATQERLYKESVDHIMSLPKDASTQKVLIEVLVEEFTKQEDVSVLTYLFDSYYDKLPVDLKTKDFKEHTLAKLRLIEGAIAPDISWEEKGKPMRLSELKGKKQYLVLFWSTGCSHCKEQLPELYRFLDNYSDIEVVAISLEKKSKEWKKVISNFKGWHHVLGLNKWENEIARKYGVIGTPDYFLLDTNKKILSKPKDFRALEKAIKKLY